MTLNDGHFDSQERREWELLQAKLQDGSISTPELLKLAQLSIEPGHDLFRAAELLETVLATDPGENMARVWLAHCWIYGFMDPASLRNALEVCNEIGRKAGIIASIRAAAFLLRGAAFYQLSAIDSARKELEASVALEPGWVANRQLLAVLYERTNDLASAREQLVRAIENTAVPSSGDPLFEWLITGRHAAGVLQRLRDQLKRLPPAATARS
ncbi:MAG TPA: hypothetical protein VF214_02695 [Edaphobacter sp.]